MAAGERCEAYAAKEVSAAKEAAYFQAGAKVSFISKVMLSMQESAQERKAKLKAHCDATETEAAKRKVITSLPLQDAGEGTRASRQYMHTAEKARVRERAPQIQALLPCREVVPCVVFLWANFCRFSRARRWPRRPQSVRFPTHSSSMAREAPSLVSC